MKRLSTSALIACFPALLVITEFLVWVGSSFWTDPYQPGGHYIPAVIGWPLFTLILLVTSRAAFLLTRRAYDQGVPRKTRVTMTIFTVLIVVFAGVYGCIRRESPGIITYPWDTVVNCCTLTGDVVNTYILLECIPPILIAGGYTISRFVKRFLGWRSNRVKDSGVCSV